ncbi:MAG: sugar transferase [Cyanobacteria bacterium P01_G01_bin.19]
MNNPTREIDFPVTYCNNCLIVKLPKRLTLKESITLQELCSESIKQNKAGQKVILDFKDTQFIDSSGIGALVRVYVATRACQQELILQSLQSPVMAALSMADLTKIFQLQSAQLTSKKGYFATHPSVHSPLKRLVDVMGATIGLAITAVIFVPVAIAIKLDSSGPILFNQTRCGWLGHRFKIWKFRSMCVEAETIKAEVSNQAVGAFFKNNLDPRVTKVGRFLRRTSLDEFPQFWNVLKGDMSLVGTRPPIPDEVVIYEVLEWQRLNVKPGMTGEWQVNGRSQISNFEDVIELDLRYQKNWSFFYDLRLIFKTVLTIFNKNSGAV